MIFPELFSNQFRLIDEKPNMTRSNKILIPIHSEIARIVSNIEGYRAISLPEKEYKFTSVLGSKKIDIAVLGEDSKLKGAIMFKGIRSEYNKNANNYYENMKGESSLFLDNGIPVYQIIFIPTYIKHINSFEKPTEQSFLNYCNFIQFHNSYWDRLKLGIFYFDIDYNNNYRASYSAKVVPEVEETLTEGVNNFMEEIKRNG